MPLRRVRYVPRSRCGPPPDDHPLCCKGRGAPFHPRWRELSQKDFVTTFDAIDLLYHPASHGPASILFDRDGGQRLLARSWNAAPEMIAAPDDALMLA